MREEKNEKKDKNIFSSRKLSTERMKVSKWRRFSLAKLFSSVLGVITLFVIAVVVGAGYYVFSAFQPMQSSSKELIEVEIPLGSSVSTVAKILEDNKLIKNEKIFYYYTRLKKENNFQAGNYHLSPASKPVDMIVQLKQGKVFEDSIKFTVAEGLTVTQIADHLSSKGIVDKKRFLEVVNNGDFSDIELMKSIPDNKERTYRLEGLLFPKTYEIHKEATEEDIIRTMLKQTEKELLPKWRETIAQGNMSLYEVFTLASIIEREVASDKEHNKVAGVYHNRLAKNMLLQADATIQFAIGEQKDRLLYKDLEMDSPYNSYKYKGLPPSPIAVPGSKSIEAAIYPEKHDYLFYVTKKDGTGEHYFSKTYEGHLANISKSKKN